MNGFEVLKNIYSSFLVFIILLTKNVKKKNLGLNEMKSFNCVLSEVFNFRFE